MNQIARLLAAAGTIFLVVATGPGRLPVKPAARQAHMVITFEDQTGAGGPGEGARVYLTDQYANQGVQFNRPAVFDYSAGVPVPGFAHSPTRAIEQCYGLEFCSTPFVMQFARPQRRVKAWVGYSARLNRSGTAVLDAYSRSGVLVGRSTATIPASDTPRIQVSVEVISSSDNIDFAHISTPDLGANGFALDDLEFSATPPDTQPPADTQAPVDTLRVPSVLGLSRAAANSEAEEIRIDHQDRRNSRHSGCAARRRPQQLPDSGTATRQGSVVRVVIARAPAQVLPRVPNLHGLTIRKAEAVLAKSRLRLTVAGSREMTGDSGTIVAQSPDSGTRVDTGTVVSVQIITPPIPPTSKRSVPTWAWLVLAAGVTLMVGSQLHRKQPHRPRTLGTLSAELKTDGVENRRVELVRHIDIEAELRFVLGASSSVQTIVGEPPAILDERRHP